MTTQISILTEQNKIYHMTAVDITSVAHQ